MLAGGRDIDRDLDAVTWKRTKASESLAVGFIPRRIGSVGGMLPSAFMCQHLELHGTT